MCWVASEPYPDPEQFNSASKCGDPKTDPDNLRWMLVDVTPVEALPRFRLPRRAARDVEPGEDGPLTARSGPLFEHITAAESAHRGQATSHPCGVLTGGHRP